MTHQFQQIYGYNIDSKGLHGRLRMGIPLAPNIQQVSVSFKISSLRSDIGGLFG
jgi:hypothetical protein